MRGVILKESEILKDALGCGIVNKKPVITLGILARYYFNEIINNEEAEDMKLVKVEVFNRLYSFMRGNYEDYKPGKWSSVINKTIDIYKDNVDKWALIDVNKIYITENEWKSICALNNNVLERISFIMLVYQKVNIIKNPNSNGWINTDIHDIFREAKVTLKGDDKIFKVNDLYNKGYISQANNCANTALKLEYIDTNSENKIHIDNFNNVISYYYEYRDKKKYRICKECGIRFEDNKSKSRSKYCRKCAKLVLQKQKNLFKEKLQS